MGIITCDRVLFSGHAVRRMFERAIRRDAVMQVVQLGETIAEYPDDDPFPSRLMLGYCQGWPLHVVVAIDAVSKTCYIVTAYDPDPNLWNEDFRTRRTP